MYLSFQSRLLPITLSVTASLLFAACGSFENGPRSRRGERVQAQTVRGESQSATVNTAGYTIPYLLSSVPSNAIRPPSLSNNQRIGVSMAKTFGAPNPQSLPNGARDALSLGFRSFKIFMNTGVLDRNFYGFDPFEYQRVPELLDKPQFREVFDMGFSSYFIVMDERWSWQLVHFLGEPIAEGVYQQIYDEAYWFARKLLERYKNTGKTFVLQNHEADWHVLPQDQFYNPATLAAYKNGDFAPSDISLSNWALYWRARQAAINQARADVGQNGVYVYHMCEITMTRPAALGKKSLLRDVVPATNCDLYGYSAYETTVRNDTDVSNLASAVALIRQHAPDSPAFGNNNVVISEIGLPEERGFRESQQMRAAMEWGLGNGVPWSLYWTLYDNECNSEGCAGFHIRKSDGQLGSMFQSFRHLLKADNSVKGVIDGIFLEGGKSYLSGWACAKNDPQPIEIHMYLGAKGFNLGVTSRPSEPQIGAACESTGTAYRFKIDLEGYRGEHGGVPISVFGISRDGSGNPLLAGSGSFKIPASGSVPSPTTTTPTTTSTTTPRTTTTLPATSPGVLGVNQSISAGQGVSSPDGSVRLIYQGDGNLVLYRGSLVLWASYKFSSPGFAVMQGDGNFVVYNSDRQPVWYSSTSGNAGAILEVRNDGFIEVKATSGAILWRAGSSVGSAPTTTTSTTMTTTTIPPVTTTVPPVTTTVPPVTTTTIPVIHTPSAGKGELLAGQSLGVNQSLASPDGSIRLVYQGDGNLVLYKGAQALWASYKFGAPGSAVMQGDGHFVVYSSSGQPVWYTGTAGNPGARLVVRNEGGFQIVSSTNQVLFETKPMGAPTVVLADRSILGTIDSVSESGVLSGWACAGTYAGSVEVHVYVDGLSGQPPQGFNIGKTNVASEAAISGICASGYNLHRFSVNLKALGANAGQKINVFGISPFGLSNNPLSNSGVFRVP